jgi:DNA-binding GntR family transcriptional regulator
VRPDPITQERVYRALKADFFAGGFEPHKRMDLAAIAERYGASKTPVREAIFRLVGERLLSPHRDGGFRIALPARGDLAHLYAWNVQLLFSALHVVGSELLRERLYALRENISASTLPAVTIVESAFLAVGQATGNPEFVHQIEAINGLLHYPRLGEAVVFRDLTREAAAMVKVNGNGVQKNVRRRILNYHKRRFEQVQRIERTWTLADAENEMN